MALLPRDADLAAGLDVAFLGVIAFVVVQFVRSVTAVPGGTPDLLRLSPGAGPPATAPELGLLRPGAPPAAPLDLGLFVPEATWLALSAVALAAIVLGPLWFWVGKPYCERR